MSAPLEILPVLAPTVCVENSQMLNQLMTEFEPGTPRHEKPTNAIPLHQCPPHYSIENDNMKPKLILTRGLQ